MDTDGMHRRQPASGELRWDGEGWRRWHGRRWVSAAYALRPQRLTSPEGFDREPVLARSSRDRALALAVEDQVTSNSATVVHTGPTGVVLAYRRPVSHLFHAFMTLVTAGLWAVIWLAM